MRPDRLAIAAAVALILSPVSAQAAACLNRVTKQPVACPGARPSSYGGAQAGLGASLVLQGPAARLPAARVCRNAITGRVRPCRAPPLPGLPPAADAGSSQTPAPPPGYGPPH